MAALRGGAVSYERGTPVNEKRLHPLSIPQTAFEAPLGTCRASWKWSHVNFESKPARKVDNWPLPWFALIWPASALPARLFCHRQPPVSTLETDCPFGNAYTRQAQIQGHVFTYGKAIGDMRGLLRVQKLH